MRSIFDSEQFYINHKDDEELTTTEKIGCTIAIIVCLLDAFMPFINSWIESIV